MQKAKAGVFRKKRYGRIRTLIQMMFFLFCTAVVYTGTAASEQTTPKLVVETPAAEQPAGPVIDSSIQILIAVLAAVFLIAVIVVIIVLNRKKKRRWDEPTVSSGGQRPSDRGGSSDWNPQQDIRRPVPEAGRPMKHDPFPAGAPIPDPDPSWMNTPSINEDPFGGKTVGIWSSPGGSDMSGAGLSGSGGMRITLTETNGRHERYTFGLFDSARVGRSDACEIAIKNDRSVSREHCRFLLGNQEVLVEDMGSQNGTFVNGRRIGRASVITNGDMLQIGDKQLQVTIGPYR